MTVTGMRPRGSNGAPYHPERDIAMIGPTLMVAAMDCLQLNQLSPELRAYADEHGITQELLFEAAGKFAESQANYVSVDDDTRVETAAEAMTNSGFLLLPLPVRLFLFSAVGQMLSGAWFKAVRDVTYMNEDSPAIDQISKLVAVGRSLAGIPAIAELPPETERAAFLVKMRQQLANRTAKVEELTQELTQVRAAQRAANIQAAALTVARQETANARDEIARRDKLSLWSLLSEWWQRPTRGASK